MIFGIPDPWIAGAFILCLVSTALCVVYGIKNWNRGDESEADLRLDQEWLAHEIEAEDKL